MIEIKEGIIKKAEESNFSGVISIFKNNKEIINEAFGYKDIINLLPNMKDTKFGIASGTKLFTALGIGILIDHGKITLNTKIKDIDKKYCSFINENATIENLLTHTSGIYDYYDEELINDFNNFNVEIPWYNLENPTDYLPLFKDHNPKFKPGERFSYSNGGFVFLGMLIEKISGISYREFINNNVLIPAQMKNSGFYALNELPCNAATGYKENRKTTNIFNLPIRGGGDGGMYTTSNDLSSFWANFFENKILSKELTKTYLKTFWEFNDFKGYGCGIYKMLDDSMFYIVGSDAGVGFDSRFLYQEKININIISNITDGEVELRKYIFTIIEQIKLINMR